MQIVEERGGLVALQARDVHMKRALDWNPEARTHGTAAAAAASTAEKGSHRSLSVSLQNRTGDGHGGGMFLAQAGG